MVSRTTCTSQKQSKPQIKYKDAIDTSKTAQARPRRVDHIHGRRRREKEKEEGEQQRNVSTSFRARLQNIRRKNKGK